MFFGIIFIVRCQAERKCKFVDKDSLIFQAKPGLFQLFLKHSMFYFEKYNKLYSDAFFQQSHISV